MATRRPAAASQSATPSTSTLASCTGPRSSSLPSSTRSRAAQQQGQLSIGVRRADMLNSTILPCAFVTT